jgi:hypothetical protein
MYNSFCMKLLLLKITTKMTALEFEVMSYIFKVLEIRTCGSLHEA